METVLLDTEIVAALLSLTVMEIVLGIDNIIFISILASRLPEEQRDRARVMGLSLAILSRLALLFSLSWVMGLKSPLFELLGHSFSGRDLILIGGGGFLVAKATREIHEKIEGEEEVTLASGKSGFIGTLIQIMLLDIVFSLDSVITAVGMVDQLWIMVVAVIISVIIMIIFSRSVSAFIHEHPTVKMLALSFLLLIGVVLAGDGLGHHIPKGYIYGAIAFSVFVEMLNLAAARKRAQRADSH
ncbi:MAG: TerC family protein [Candidatus Obscuribacterales bacterium]